VKVHLRVAEQFFEGVELIGFFVVDVFNTGIDQDLKTVDAGCVGNINRGVFDTGTVFRGLCNGIHFRMDCTKAILLGFTIRGLGFVDKAAHVCAMGHAGGCAVISGGQDALVTYDYRADFGPRTC